MHFFSARFDQVSMAGLKTLASLSIVVLVCLSLVGCLKSTSVITVAPDGAAKFELLVEMDLNQPGMFGESPDLDELTEEVNLESMVENIPGFDAYLPPEIREEDGVVFIRMVAYTRDISRLGGEAMAFSSFGMMMVGGGGGMEEDMGGPGSYAAWEAQDGGGELQLMRSGTQLVAAMWSEMRKELVDDEDMASMMLEPFAMTETVVLPGPITNGVTPSRTLTGLQILNGDRPEWAEGINQLSDIDDYDGPNEAFAEVEPLVYEVGPFDWTEDQASAFSAELNRAVANYHRMMGIDPNAPATPDTPELESAPELELVPGSAPASDAAEAD